MLELGLYTLYAVLTILMIVMTVRLSVALRSSTTTATISNKIDSKELPSVSVCIPARNEMHAMSDCLELVLASDYPKLEIIVLDDNSADNTSALVKSFAHEGVRFIEGKSLPRDWLGKNNALQGLYEEASGKYILFMGVDTRIQKSSLSKLVSYIESRNVDMVSVLPLRVDSWRASVLFSTLRYFWVLLFQNKSRPAIASNAWMINRKKLESLDGIEPYKSDVQPEAKIASELNKDNKYNFIVSNADIGFSYEKKLSSQVDTSIRLLYSVFNKTIVGNILAALLIVLLNVPLFVILSSVFIGWTVVQSVATWQLVIFMSIYGMYTSTVWRKTWWIGALLWPIIILQELIIFIVAIYRNRTNSVTWKGRPIQTSWRR